MITFNFISGYIPFSPGYIVLNFVSGSGVNNAIPLSNTGLMNNMLIVLSI